MKAGKIDEVRDYHSYLALFCTREDGRPTEPESYEKVQLLQKKNVMLFSPVVPCIYRKEDVERYYQENCFMLTNKKEKDNYIDVRCKSA